MIRAFPSRATKFRGIVAVGVFGLALASLASCSTVPVDYGPMSDRRIYAPEGYDVDWDLPETDAFWLPSETKDDILIASQSCGAAIQTFLYHHWPRPPQFSYIGFRFEPKTSQTAKDCVIGRVKAIPALTVYPAR